MTLVMYDSTSVPAIPANGDIVAGYVNGSIVPPTWNALVAAFPDIPKVAIDVNGAAPGAQVRDWETGDKGGNLEDWVIEHNQLSGASDAVIYCNRSTIAEVRQLTGSQILNQDYYLWIATLDGTIYGPDQLTGVIACQYMTVNGPNGAYDVSEVWTNASIWWSDGVINDPAPPPPGGGLPANWTYGPVQNMSLVNYGPHSFSVSFNAPVATAGTPAGVAKLGITDYQVAVTVGPALSGPNISGYPRYIAKGSNPQSWQGGGLAPGTQYSFGVRALYQDAHAGGWMGGTFTTPAS